jgi:hypothetical protein
MINFKFQISNLKLSKCGVIALAGAVAAGCRSPEDGRPRAGGHGGDAGNYVRGAVHAPSKIDGTKTWTARPGT